MTIQALRRLLDEIDAQGGPQAARDNRLRLPDDEPQPERNSPPMTTTPTAPIVDVQLRSDADVRLKATVFEPEPLPVGRLLKWGDEHHDADIRDQAARARLTLAGLRKRHAADQELVAITAEAEQLEQRLAELRAREQEIAPAKAKAPRRKVDLGYDSRTVRAWARENGADCPATGRVPKAVVDQWKAAAAQASGGPS